MHEGLLVTLQTYKCSYQEGILCTSSKKNLFGAVTTSQRQSINYFERMYTQFDLKCLNACSQLLNFMTEKKRIENV